MSLLSERIKIIKVSNATGTGQGAINSDAVDMKGYEGVLFFVAPGAITGGGAQSINAAQDVASNGSFADLTGSKVTIADDDDNQVFWLDVHQPSKRYVRLEIARASANSAFGEIYAIQYGGHQLPEVNNIANTSTGEAHLTPAEGTP